MSDRMTPQEKLAARVAQSAESAINAIDALISDLQDNRSQIVAWAAGKPAREPRLYGNRLGGAADAVADFRATIQTTHYANAVYGAEEN